MDGDTVWRLQAIPLTPIHVGDGSSFTPDSYDLRDGKLCRFNPHRVLAAMDGEDRRRFQQALDAGRLHEASGVLRVSATDDLVEECLPIADTSAAELRKAFADTRRYGAVSPFVRTLGQPFLPGSTLKGALRTAWLSKLAGDTDRAALDRAVMDGPPKFKAERAEVALLERQRNRVEQDPLRHLYVEDVRLDGIETRIDRVVNWRPETAEGEGAEKIQLHVERLLSAADGVVRGVKFRVRLEDPARQARRRDLDARRAASRDLTADELWSALRDFHWRVFDAERARFWSKLDEADRRLSACFAFPFGGKPREEADWRRSKGVALVRIGRFGHFESKSIEGLRSQKRPRTSEPVSAGRTRMVAECTREGRTARVPFGWMLLMRLKAPS